MVQPLGKTVWQFFSKVNIALKSNIDNMVLSI